MKKLLSVITLSAVFALSSLEAAQSASIFEPARDKQYCSSAIPQYPGRLPKRLKPDLGNYQYGTDIAIYMDNYSQYIMQLMEAATVSRNASDLLRQEITRSARARLLQYDPLANGPPVFFALLAMTPITIAYAQHKSEYPLSDQKVVEDWIDYHINHIMDVPYFASTDTDNKKYYYGVWLATFGRVKNNADMIQRATDIFKIAIERQRYDGSLLNDSQRGGCAVHYTAKAVGALVTLATILSDEENNYFNYRVGRKSLNSIIGFLISATEDNSLISGYASDPEWSSSCFPGFSAEHQDVSWTIGQNSNWGYYYIDQNPAAVISKRLKRLSTFLRNGERAYNAYAAGNPVCYLGKVPR